MHDFIFKKGELYCEKLRVSKVASLNKTPFYLYSRKTVTDHYHKLDEAFSPMPHLICYSLKANSNLAICRLLAELGAGADITSGGELYKATRAGVPPGRIVFAGVGKSEDEITYALDTGILMFNVESIQELYLINEIAGKLRKKASVAIRLNPDVDVDTHAYIRTGASENKFGLPFDYAEALYLKRAHLRNIRMVGVHIHIGSQITTVKPYLQAIKKVAGFIRRLKDKGVVLEWLDMGGGMGIIYKDEKPSTAAEFADALIPFLKPTGLRVIIQPGRFIVGNAGILVTRVLYTKKTKARNFVVVDAGMNDLIRPTLYHAYHGIKPIHTSPMREETADIVGPICESGDFLARERSIPRVKRGDLLAVFSVGAYGFSMASNYNSRPRPAEILVDNDRFTLIRGRETYEDLTCAEMLRFTKMSAGGNDFIIVDNRCGSYPDGALLAQELCRRSFSIGADGILLLERSAKQGRFRMRIFNPDGSEAEMCGNGARCIAAFAYRKGISGRKMKFETIAGIIEAEVVNEEVKLRMNNPRDMKLSMKLAVDGKKYHASFINTGVPHAVLIVESVDGVPVESLGRKIRNLNTFSPGGTNVDFTEVVDSGRIRLRTYERGVEAETLACGTGAVASSIVLSLLGRVKPPVSVETKGGAILKVYFKESGNVRDVYLQGDANFVYEGALGYPLGASE